jgi:hypothetical protein
MKLDESAGIAISPVAIELHCHLIGANDRVVWSVIFDLELLAEDLAEQGGMVFEKRANGTARKQTHRSDLPAPMAAFHPNLPSAFDPNPTLATPVIPSVAAIAPC